MSIYHRSAHVEGPHARRSASQSAEDTVFLFAENQHDVGGFLRKLEFN